VTALRLSKLGRPNSLTRFTVGRASKPEMASLVVDVSKNAPALEGETEPIVCRIATVDEPCWLPFAA